MMWFSLLIVLLESSVVTEDGTVVHTMEVKAYERLWSAPSYAVPWALVRAIVGAIISRMGGALEVLTTCAGMMVGGSLTLATGSRDGWLLLALPVVSFVGAFVGLLIGTGTRVVLGRRR
jgi:hypothetical protein